MSFTSEEKDGQIKPVWPAQMALLEQRQDKLTHLEKKRDHPMLETLSLFILIPCLLFVLIPTGADA